MTKKRRYPLIIKQQCLVCHVTREVPNKRGVKKVFLCSKKCDNARARYLRRLKEMKNK